MDQQTAKRNTSGSPSAGKPALVLESWKALGLPIEAVNFKPCSMAQMSLAHSTEYVRAVMSLERSNGFGNAYPEVRDSLPYTTGSMAQAALYSFKTGEPSASLTSGFHHASYSNGGAFCTFNGLIIAAQVCRLAGAKKVGIIDLDMHYGNGTEDIIKKLGLDYIEHYTFGGNHVTSENADAWLAELPKIICKFGEVDVLLFQAGADPHINDPLGGVLTTEQMRRRDEIVFRVAKQLKIPVVFNLAGGYQEPLRKVLDIHDSTAVTCIEVFGETQKKGARNANSENKKSANCNIKIGA